MYLSRIRIENFRNFSELDVALSDNIVVVGENRVGKSNLLFGLRLIFDPSLPDTSRQLGLADFWDGLEGCCQSNANCSPLGIAAAQRWDELSHDLLPLSQGG